MNNFVAKDLEIANADRTSNCSIGITEIVEGILHPSQSWVVQPKGNYFYGKNVCFTGTYSDDTRKGVLQENKEVGGVPSDFITKKPEVLIVGLQDFHVVGEAGMANKQKKLIDLI